MTRQSSSAVIFEHQHFDRAPTWKECFWSWPLLPLMGYVLGHNDVLYLTLISPAVTTMLRWGLMFIDGMDMNGKQGHYRTIRMTQSGITIETSCDYTTIDLKNVSIPNTKLHESRWVGRHYIDLTLQDGTNHRLDIHSLKKAKRCHWLINQHTKTLQEKSHTAE